MRSRDIVRLPKTVTKAGSWKVTTGTAKMPPGAFPLSRRSSYRLSRGYHWRVDELEGGGMVFRLLTAFNTDKSEFEAILGTPVPGGLRVIARLEFHGTHPGWHCHATCRHDHEDVPIGEQSPRMFERAPVAAGRHRRQAFVRTETEAEQKAFRFFSVKPDRAWSLEG
jgi:hypothetical protein